MPVGNPNWFAALPINDLVRWSFNADRCFIIMPRSDSDDGYGRQRANPDHLDEPLNALINMGDSNNRYLQYVDYGAGNIDWISADGREQISWTGGTMRYTHGVLAGTIAQHLTGQAENGARVEYDKAGGGGSYTSELIGDSTAPDQYIWRHGVRYDVGGEILGAMAYSEPGHSYFIVAYRATTETAGIRTIKLTRVEFDPDTDQTIGSATDLTSDMVADCGGGIPTGLTAPIPQPVFFNRAGTELCTIAALKIGDTTDFYVITASANTDRSAWTFSRGERCVKGNTATTTTETTGSVGAGSEYSVSGWFYPATYTYTRTIVKSYIAIFAVDWCGERLTTAKWTLSQTLTSYKNHPEVTLIGDSGGATDNRLGFDEDILDPEDELSDYYGDSEFSESDTTLSRIQISGGWNAYYSLSNYTKTEYGGFHVSYDPIPASASGTYSGVERALIYLDLRHKHIVINDYRESALTGNASAEIVSTEITLETDYSGTMTARIDSALFGEGLVTSSIGSFDISPGNPFTELTPPQLVSEYAATSSSSSTTVFSELSGPWYGNSNWTTIATLADGKTAWLHMAVHWPAIVSDLPWSPSNANSRHWINRTTGPLAPPSLSAIANGVGLSGSNPRFHAVRPAIIPSPETSPDAPE